MIFQRITKSSTITTITTTKMTILMSPATQMEDLTKQTMPRKERMKALHTPAAAAGILSAQSGILVAAAAAAAAASAVAAALVAAEAISGSKPQRKTFGDTVQ